jgi:hypothetical protein
MTRVASPFITHKRTLRATCDMLSLLPRWIEPVRGWLPTDRGSKSRHHHRAEVAKLESVLKWTPPSLIDQRALAELPALSGDRRGSLRYTTGLLYLSGQILARRHPLIAPIEE